MKLTMKEKLIMCKEHVIENKSLSHISEEHDNYDIGEIKYLVNLYKRYGDKPFINRENGIYRRDTKLMAISRVKNGESIRTVSIDFGLINYRILADWVKKYDIEGEKSIQDTYPRRNYLNEDERYKKTIDKSLLEENERLKAEIDFLKKSQSLAQKLEELTTEEKVSVVNELRLKYSLKILLKISKSSKSTFYYTLSKNDKDDKNNNLIEKIKEIFYSHKERYGYRRITLELYNQGFNVNHKKVYRLMVKFNLVPVVRRKRKYSSYKGTIGKIADNLINREFVANKPNKKWCTDITEFKLNNDKIYLSPILDGYNQEVISYNISKSPNLEQINDMLKKAFDNRELRDLVFHSDQGWQYQHQSYQSQLKDKKIKQSMSRKGNIMDNGLMENFFGILKTEMFYDQEYKYNSIDDLINAIDEYIYYYNHDRIKVKLKGLSPVQFRVQSLIQ